MRKIIGLSFNYKPTDLNDFIVNMPEAEHQKHIDAINRFIVSPQAKYFSAKNFTDIIVKGIPGDAIT